LGGSNVNDPNAGSLLYLKNFGNFHWLGSHNWGLCGNGPGGQYAFTLVNKSNAGIAEFQNITTEECGGDGLFTNWLGGTTYSSGQGVHYMGEDYVSKVNGNIGNTPNVSPNQWKLWRSALIDLGTGSGNYPGVVVGNVGTADPEAAADAQYLFHDSATNGQFTGVLLQNEIPDFGQISNFPVYISPDDVQSVRDYAPNSQIPIEAYTTITGNSRSTYEATSFQSGEVSAKVVDQNRLGAPAYARI